MPVPYYSEPTPPGVKHGAVVNAWYVVIDDITLDIRQLANIPEPNHRQMERLDALAEIIRLIETHNLQPTDDGLALP